MPYWRGFPGDSRRDGVVFALRGLGLMRRRVLFELLLYAGSHCYCIGRFRPFAEVAYLLCLCSPSGDLLRSKTVRHE